MDTIVMAAAARRPFRHSGRPKRPIERARLKLRVLTERSASLAAGTYFTLLALFGGGVMNWTPAYMLLTLATIGFTLLVAWRGGFDVLRTLPPLARWSLVGIAVLPLLQIVPMPPALWHALPGQELRRQVLTLVGLDDSWQPLSLEPVSTACAAILALGFVTLTALLLRLDDRAFRRFAILAQAIVLVGILVGLSQVATEGQFPNPHGVGTGGVLLGFYANKNHMALVLAITIPLFSLIVAPDLFGRRRALPARLGYTGFALICIVATNSRAGLLLGLVATAFALWDIVGRIPRRYKLAALVLAAAAIWLVTSTTAFHIVSNRFEDVDGDLRWRFLSWTWPLAERYALLGSGAGSFTTLFITSEQLAWVKPTIVNHAHNEYLQLVIEFGIPGCLLLLLTIASLVSPLRQWRALPPRDPRRIEMLFGLAAVLLFVLHSAVDYPLRRPAVWVFLAFALAAFHRRPSELAPVRRGGPEGS